VLLGSFLACRPAWSPDGRKQAFVTDPAANAAGLVATPGGTLRLGAR